MPDRQPPTFAVIGEALIDLAAPADDGASVARPGGSPMNVAIGLARLGQPTAFVGRLSDDPIGTLLRRHLARSAVDLRHVVYATDPGTIALVELSGRAGALRVLAARSGLPVVGVRAGVLAGGARAVHFGSLASWLPPGDSRNRGRRRQATDRGHVLISYDPNIRPALLPDVMAARRQIEESVGLAHVVKASAEDLAWLYGPRASRRSAGDG